MLCTGGHRRAVPIQDPREGMGSLVTVTVTSRPSQLLAAGCQGGTRKHGGRPARRPPVCKRRFKAGEWRAIRCHRADSMIAASSVGLRRSCLAADPLALPLVRHFQQPQPLCCALLVGEDIVVVLFPTANRLNTHT